MSKNKVLVITTSPDVHVERVQEHLEADIEIFDPSLFPLEQDITYEWLGDRFSISSMGRRFDDVISVWFRKPRILDPEDLPVEKQYQEFVHGSYRQAVTSIYNMLSNKLWVSNVWAIKRVNQDKVYQLEVANSLGLRIPKTVVTSNSEHARMFVQSVGRAITKSLGNSFAFTDTGGKNFFTTRISADDDIDFGGLCVQPAIFQEEVDIVADIRATVIGEHVVPCMITKTGEMSSEIDYRIGTFSGNLSYEYYHNFPKELTIACLNMVKRLGLEFGAIDFVLDSEGNHIFLEINPNGQYDFIEMEADIELSHLMADLLMSPVKG